MADLSNRAPRTFGELRRLLAELGDPWQPDPSLSDDEPLPEYPTGGDGVYEPPDKVLPEGGVIDVLKDHPPTNPDLRAVWREEGLVDEPDQGSAPADPKPSRKERKGNDSPTPGSDAGG